MVTYDHSYQERVHSFVIACFGEKIASDMKERGHRFLEESLELYQSIGCTKEDAHTLVEYVFNRPKGDPYKEAGGVMVTLMALCNAAAIDCDKEAETELQRVWTIIDKIRAKHATKPMSSPLPGITPKNDDISVDETVTFSVVRHNLMNRYGYTPYCGNPLSKSNKISGGCSNPRTIFNGRQFFCHECGWVSKFPESFITEYKKKWGL